MGKHSRIRLDRCHPQGFAHITLFDLNWRRARVCSLSLSVTEKNECCSTEAIIFSFLPK